MSDSFFPSPFEETYSGSGYLEQGCRKMQVMVQKQQVSGVSKQKDSLSFMLLVHHGSACWLCSTQFSLQTRQLEESQVGTLLIVVTGERRSEIRRVSCQQSNSPLMSQTFNMVPHSHTPGSAGDAGVLGSILGSGKSPGAENDNSLQYSCLGNPVDRGAWWATVHGVTKSQTWLSMHGHLRPSNHRSQGRKMRL